MDRELLQEVKTMLDLHRDRWKTACVREHFLPVPFLRFLNLHSRTLLAAGGVDVGADGNLLNCYFDALSQARGDAPVNHIPRWMTFGYCCKDTRLLLPHRTGQPYRYLTAEQVFPRLVDSDHDFDPKLFRLEKELLSREGTAIVGWARTPFIIFADSIPREAIRKLEQRLRQIPDYQDIRCYCFPAGWVRFKLSAQDTGREQDSLFLVDVGHLDGVAQFFPAQVRKVNHSALLLDSWYQQELLVQENEDFRMFMREQGVDIKFADGAEALLIGAARPTPDRDFFVFSASENAQCRLWDKLELKDDHIMLVQHLQVLLHF